MGSNHTKSKSTTKKRTVKNGKENKGQFNAPHRHGTTNLSIIWVSHHITQEVIVKLRSIVNHVESFHELNACMNYLKVTKAQKVLIVTDETLGKALIPKIHSLVCIDSIYLISTSNSVRKDWMKKWPKLKDIYANFEPLYEKLQMITQSYDEQIISISFSTSSTNSSNKNQNELQASFMYTQLFKNILLEMNHTDKSRQDFMSYSQSVYNTNPDELEIIAEFSYNYRPDRAIWWYTRECFIYQMLNRALRLLQADIIVNMGFFISDLHRQIDELHKKQLPIYRDKTFLLYRGQALSSLDFEKLATTQGGLMSFNNFLSTSKNQSKSLEFAQEALEKPNTVGILFILIIDPTLKSSPFADIKCSSYFEQEEEVLFSMHTVFRIEDITSLDKENRLFKVRLRLTADDDEDLRRLTDQIQKEVGDGTASQRLGSLLIQVGQVNKAEELCLGLLEQIPTQYDTAYYNHQLGRVKTEQGAYKEAIEYHEKALEIEKEKLPPTHPMLVASYISLGLVCSKMAEHSKALNYHNQALEIQLKTLMNDHSDLATSYNNIGLVYNDLGKYSEALSYFDKAVSIDKKNLPTNHPSFASSYNNIGSVYCKMGDYQNALSNHNQALEIQRKTLPSEHPAVATSISNIGLVYYQMGDYSTALSYYNEALLMRCKTLPAKHPDLAKSYDNIGLVHFSMHLSSEALSYYEKALAIRQETLHTDHSDLASSFSNIGAVHRQLHNNSVALSYYTQALEIDEKVLSKDHPELANSYNNIATVHFNMEQYEDALVFYEKVRAIKENLLPMNYVSLAHCHCNIGLCHRHLKAFTEALLNYEKALDLRLKYLPNNYTDLSSSYNSIGCVYYDMKEYSKAIDAYEKSRWIQETYLSSNNAQLAITYNHIGSAYYGLKEYSKALNYYEKGALIKEQISPKNHADLAHSYSNLGLIHRALKDYRKSLSCYQQAFEILEKYSPSSKKQMDSIRSTIENMQKSM